MNFPALDGKKIFVTGGTGFFGKSILDMLRRGLLPGTQFVILSRDPRRFLEKCPEFSDMPRVRFIAGDVKDFPFPQEKFDLILHAATPAVTTLAPGEMRDVIINGTRHVLDFAGFCGARKLMLTSSGAVYGPQPPEVPNVSEDHPCRPVTEYGIAKLEAEQMCVDAGIFTLLPRCFAFVGPYLDRNIHFAVGNFIRDALDRQPIVIRGDGTPFRSYLYADDLVEWLFTILDRGESGRPYNVGSPEGISIADLARTVASCFEPVSEVRVLGTPVPGAPPARYVPDVTRAEKELGLKVKTGLREAIAKVREQAS